MSHIAHIWVCVSVSHIVDIWMCVTRLTYMCDMIHSLTRQCVSTSRHTHSYMCEMTHGHTHSYVCNMTHWLTHSYMCDMTHWRDVFVTINKSHHARDNVWTKKSRHTHTSTGDAQSDSVVRKKWAISMLSMRYVTRVNMSHCTITSIRDAARMNEPRHTYSHTYNQTCNHRRRYTARRWWSRRTRERGREAT